MQKGRERGREEEIDKSMLLAPFGEEGKLYNNNIEEERGREKVAKGKAKIKVCSCK